MYSKIRKHHVFVWLCVAVVGIAVVWKLGADYIAANERHMNLEEQRQARASSNHPLKANVKFEEYWGEWYDVTDVMEVKPTEGFITMPLRVVRFHPEVTGDVTGLDVITGRTIRSHDSQQIRFTKAGKYQDRVRCYYQVETGLNMRDGKGTPYKVVMPLYLEHATVTVE